MAGFKKGFSILVCIIIVLTLLAGPALAKGGGSKGFSSGGRSSFSSGAKGVSSTGSSFSSKPSGSVAASKPAAGVSSGSSAVSSAPAAGSGASAVQSTPENSVGGGASSYGKGFSTDTGSFSTPRQNSPPALHSDYSTDNKGYSTGSGSYSTGTGSYNGAWNRDAAAGAGIDKYPSRPPVGIFGSVPQSPYNYNNQYWGMPWYSRMFFQPNYYWMPWGYHFFAPRLITWIIVIILIGAAVIFIRSRMKGSTF